MGITCRPGKQGQLLSGNGGRVVQPVVKIAADGYVRAPCENDARGRWSHTGQVFEAGKREPSGAPGNVGPITPKAGCRASGLRPRPAQGRTLRLRFLSGWCLVPHRPAHTGARFGGGTGLLEKTVCEGIAVGLAFVGLHRGYQDKDHIDHDNCYEYGQEAPE